MSLAASQQLYTTYSNVEIDPTSYSPATNNIHTPAINATINYQNHLQSDVASRESINKDINDQLQYTMMAMTIWVPLGIFVGYYLYNKGNQ